MNNGESLIYVQHEARNMIPNESECYSGSTGCMPNC